MCDSVHYYRHERALKIEVNYVNLHYEIPVASKYRKIIIVRFISETQVPDALATASTDVPASFAMNPMHVNTTKPA